jgi:hypothetical protein
MHLLPSTKLVAAAAECGLERIDLMRAVKDSAAVMM